jgi:hypothetical protein
MFFIIILTHFFLVIFFNLVCVYEDLELIIYFNLPFIWLSQYQKNISTSG